MMASVRALQVIPIVASSKTLLVRSDCVSREKSTTVACGWPSINKQMQETILNQFPFPYKSRIYHSPSPLVKFMCFSLVSGFGAGDVFGFEC